MSMDETVRVPLTDERKAVIAGTMATKVDLIKALREKKAADAKATQAEIDEAIDELQELAKVVNEGQEEQRQGDLFTPSTDEAAQGIADVAAVAEGGAAPTPALNLAERYLTSLEGGKLDRGPFVEFCESHGVRGGRKRKALWEEIEQLYEAASSALATPATQPLPSEPHAFTGEPEGNCTVCGGSFDDPVHQDAPAQVGDAGP